MWTNLHRLHWRHNGRDSVSNHQLHDCLLNRLFTRRSKKTSKPRVTGLCAGNSPGTGKFPAQMASNTENVSIWWCHHEYCNSIPSQIAKTSGSTPIRHRSDAKMLDRDLIRSSDNGSTRYCPIGSLRILEHAAAILNKGVGFYVDLHSLHQIHFVKNIYDQLVIWCCKYNKKLLSMNNYELLNIQACSFRMFWTLAAPNL